MRLTSPFLFFFFNDTATTEIYTLSLHDALPISGAMGGAARARTPSRAGRRMGRPRSRSRAASRQNRRRSEEHTSELQSLAYLVCRLLLEKKKKKKKKIIIRAAHVRVTIHQSTTD